MNKIGSREFQAVGKACTKLWGVQRAEGLKNGEDVYKAGSLELHLLGTKGWSGQLDKAHLQQRRMEPQS